MSPNSVLTLSHITFTFPEAPDPLLTDISVTFPRGWTAVLGDNGIGKTTLIRIALGDLYPDSGSVSPAPDSIAVGYCPQNTDETPVNLDDFANDWSPEALAIRRDLGIGDDWPWRPDTLSGGETKRLQIACALALRPDVLVLDEPTNHVDGPTRERIVAALRSFDGIGILVSHDVALIDTVADRCAFFERGHVRGRNITVVRARPGNYSIASASAAIDRQSADTALRDARREFARLSSVKAQRKHDATLEVSSASNHRFVDPKDHDARNAIKYNHNPSSLGPASARIDAQVATAWERAAQVVTAAKRYDGDIWMDAESSGRRELVRLPAGFIAYADGGDEANDEHGSGNGVDVPMLTVGPHDHIGISGPNGTGKTMVVNALLRAIERDERRTGLRLPRLVVPQNTTTEDARQAMEALAALPARDRGVVLSSVAQLNADPDRLLAGGNPSPGELRKLLLCLGLRRHPHLIVMDEPTNHLDLHSMRALGRALSRYPGALVLVSHDEGFLAETATIRWSMRRDGTRTRLMVG
ncbi:ATP-binding cassette domain-containing protein [Bifidobacterium aerophilum]|uniref:ATP-binding cassette domain-containing protein n=1 Tax=Bifidobacterium aerophilum TaxID=1798155 RepID=A0A6N9Z3N2_9BIFI|nr:ATP-binding cassette domain-containing protein [Bifidobacterium aerophilum]NEG89257.1 ATP-binding cassette domain-containing protein [Bifidobacterium aerophilum]